MSSLLLPESTKAQRRSTTQLVVHASLHKHLISYKLEPITAVSPSTTAEETAEDVRLTTARVDNTHKKGLKHPNTPGGVQSYTEV